MLTHPNIETLADLHKNVNSKKNYLKNLIEYLKEDNFIVASLTSEEVETKFMGFCQYSKRLPVRRIDIRYMPYESYYPSLIYFTGSGNFNRSMRQHAVKLGYKLNEYGLYKKIGEKFKNIPISSEKEVFDILEMDYVLPKDRL